MCYSGVGTRLPIMLAALPLWFATPSAWNRKLVDLLSPVWSAILLPMSLMKLRAIGAQDPMVSVATGITRYPEFERV